MKGGKIRVIPFAILGISLLCYLALWLFLYGEFHSQSSSALKDYPECLRRIGYPAAQFFPAQIPEKAQDVSFCFQPAVLQGGCVLSLRYTAPQENVETLLRSLPRSAKWTGTVRENDSQETGIFDATLSALQDKKTLLPPDLTLYLLHSKPYKVDDWNHGEVAFVALSQSRCELLFYYERW